MNDLGIIKYIALSIVLSSTTISMVVLVIFWMPLARYVNSFNSYSISKIKELTQFLVNLTYTFSVVLGSAFFAGLMLKIYTKYQQLSSPPASKGECLFAYFCGGIIGFIMYSKFFKKTQKRQPKLFSQIEKDVEHWKKDPQRPPVYVALFLNVKNGVTLDDFTDNVLSKISKEKLYIYDSITNGSFYSYTEHEYDVKKYNVSDDRDLAYIFFKKDGNLYSKDDKKVFFGDEIWDPNKFDSLITDLIKTIKAEDTQHQH